MPIDVRQYDSALAFINDDRQFSRIVGNLQNQDDRKRLKAYELYEDFYSNRPEHIRVTLRGEDDDCVEIYMPSAKKCIEAVNRFLAVDFDYQLDPDSGTETTQQAVDTMLTSYFDKHEIRTKFGNFKRYGLVKGDALLHIQAFPWERAGNRVCVHELKPEHYFPIEDFVSGQTIGCHIVDVILNPKNSAKTRNFSDQWIVRRQTYMRQMSEPDKDGNQMPTGRITSKLCLCQVSRWDDRNEENEIVIIEDLQNEFVLDERITNIPVYHWGNNTPPGSSFGMSELAGVETLINAMNQSMTDEDLTLITQGLGVYWSDASPPIDENGDEVPWEIGPGYVVQIASGANFGRVTGVSSLTPFHEHIQILDENMQQAMAVPDVAIGMVDVAAVESGIALQLKFGPLLAHNKEKEPCLEKVINEFIEDLLVWLTVYESLVAENVVATAVFGDPMPQNKTQMLADYLSIWVQAPSTLPVQWLYDRLNELYGWDLSDTDFQTALEDAQKIAQTAMPPDPFGQQMQDEQGNPVDQYGNPAPPQQNGAPVPFANQYS
jgi:hypothetical protein